MKGCFSYPGTEVELREEDGEEEVDRWCYSWFQKDKVKAVRFRFHFGFSSGGVLNFGMASKNRLYCKCLF